MWLLGDDFSAKSLRLHDPKFLVALVFEEVSKSGGQAVLTRALLICWEKVLPSQLLCFSCLAW